jgi:hypothetical protein
LTPPTDGGIALARRLSNREVINLQELQDRNLQGNESDQLLLEAVFKSGLLLRRANGTVRNMLACLAEGRGHKFAYSSIGLNISLESIALFQL